MVVARRGNIPRIVTVAGGKGGVGKSTVAANLALALGRQGQRVALVDADFGAANLHTLFGVLHPKTTLADFLDHRIDALDEATITVANTVELVPGTSRPGAANLDARGKVRLIRAISRLQADCIIVDVGAGASFTIVDLVATADIKLFVLTPQLPSLHNAYALLKACVHRVVRKLSSDDIQQNLIDAALGNESKARTIPQLLGVLRPLDGVLADAIVDTLLRFGVALVGNQVGSDADIAALDRMSPLIYEHLLVHAPLWAGMRRTQALQGGLRAGANTIADRKDPAFAAFSALARAVADCDLARLRGEQRATKMTTVPLWIQREAECPGT